MGICSPEEGAVAWRWSSGACRVQEQLREISSDHIGNFLVCIYKIPLDVNSVELQERSHASFLILRGFSLKNVDLQNAARTLQNTGSWSRS